MCQSYKLHCSCNQSSAEIFFGNMVLNESAVERLHCPKCSSDIETNCADRVWDNGWVLELNMDAIKVHASTFGVSAGDLTAEWIFDSGYATWVGITPDDTECRNRERDEIQKLAKTDLLAYYEAMKNWGLGREKRFSAEGWRKMQGRV